MVCKQNAVQHFQPFVRATSTASNVALTTTIATLFYPLQMKRGNLYASFCDANLSSLNAL